MCRVAALREGLLQSASVFVVLEIVSGFLDPLEVIPKESEPFITGITNQAANLVCIVVVIDAEGTVWLIPTTRAEVILEFAKFFVLRDRDVVFAS